MILLALAMFAESATANQTVDPAPAAPKLICRKYDVTGSLVTKQRVCRTAAAWSKVQDDQQAEAQRLTPHLTTEHGG